jgi:8-oxo-dGTP diphosphatase
MDSPIITANVVLLTRDGHILLVKSSEEPYAGVWSLPGGSLRQNETVLDCAFRGLDATSLTVEGLRLFEVLDTPGRDPRGHSISIVFIEYLSKSMEETALELRRDVSAAGWFPFRKLPTLAFDFGALLADRLENEYLAYQIVHEEER